MSMQQRIESTLALLQPEHLQVLDESHMHSRGLQTHFKAVVVSAQLWRLPTAMVATPLASPVTAVGVLRWAVLPSPSWPQKL